MYFQEFKEWFEKIDKEKNLNNNEIRLIVLQLNYLEISYLIEKLKNLDLLIKNNKTQNFFQKLGF